MRNKNANTAKKQLSLDWAERSYFWYTPNGSPNKNRDTRTGLHSTARDTFQTQLFSLTAEMWARCCSWEMDRLTLTLFGLDREQEVAIKELFEALGWDYVHEISLPFLNFVETFLAIRYHCSVLSQRLKGRVIVVPVPSM